MTSTGRSALGPQRLERSPAEQPEPPGVVGEVAAARRAVDAVAVEGGRVVDESQPVAVCRDIDDRQLDRAAERMRVRYAERPCPGRRTVRHGHRPVARAGTRRRGHRSLRGPWAGSGRGRRRRRRDRRSLPTARISAAMNATRKASSIGPMVATGRGHRPYRRPCAKPVEDARRNRYHPADMHPAPQVPSIPAATFRLPPPARGSSPPRLQPLLVLASAGPDDLEPDRSRDVDAPPQPDPGPERPRRMDPPPRRHDVHGRGQGRPPRVRPLHRERVGQLVPAHAIRTRRRARSPTSAPSTGSTSRSGSTRAVWACSPATIRRRRPTWPCPSSASG